MVVDCYEDLKAVALTAIVIKNDHKSNNNIICKSEVSKLLLPSFKSTGNIL